MTSVLTIVCVPSSLTVASGDDVTVDIGISSMDGCGEIEYNFMMIFVYSENRTWGWMNDAEADAATSSLERIDPAELWDTTLYLNGGDPNLRYCWTDETMIVGTDGVIPTQIIPATDEAVYRFTWKQNEYAPGGSSLRIVFEMGGWTDPTTGEQIYDYTTTEMSSVEVITE